MAFTFLSLYGQLPIWNCRPVQKLYSLFRQTELQLKPFWEYVFCTVYVSRCVS
jgi:hypothetical protein